MTSLAPADAYRIIAEGYDDAPNPLIALEQRTLTPLLPDTRNLRVADVGAGTGRWTRYLQARGAHTIATDLCDSMLALAPPPRVLADNRALPLRANTFDLVLCSFAFSYAPDAFPEIVRIVRPGGQLIVTDVHQDAIRRGWTRTFRIGNRMIAPDHHEYSLTALCHPHATLGKLIEPHLGEAERDIFVRAGKSEAFEAATLHPAIFIAIFLKL